MFSLIFLYLYLLCLWKDQIKTTTRKLLPSRYSVLNTCFLSFFRMNEEARCNLQFRMHQNVAFSQILWPRTDKYDMKVWFGIFFWTLTPSHFLWALQIYQAENLFGEVRRSVLLPGTNHPITVLYCQIWLEVSVLL